MGHTGSGKTTFAATLAQRLSVPHVELDALFWRPGWAETPAEEFRERVAAALADRDGWVVDGNYRSRLGTFVLDDADVVVWLDPPLAVMLARVLRRTWRRVRSGEHIWGTNVETWRGGFLGRDSLLVWAVATYRRSQRRNRALASRYRVVRLRSGLDVERFLADVG